MKTQELISSCCSASPTEDIPVEMGFCPDCREHASFIDPDEICQTCGYEECQCVTYEDGSKEPVVDGLIRPAFKPTSDDAIAFAGTVVMLLAMLGLIAILQ